LITFSNGSTECFEEVISFVLEAVDGVSVTAGFLALKGFAVVDARNDLGVSKGGSDSVGVKKRVGATCC